MGHAYMNLLLRRIYSHDEYLVQGVLDQQCMGKGIRAAVLDLAVLQQERPPYP